MANVVELGYLEPCADERRLLSPFFPSKFGGKPAWLRLDNIPSAERLACSTCNWPMVFLLQLYAPSDRDESAFHRMLYVFLCRNSSCWKPHSSNASVRILRNQMARVNDYYSSEPLEPSSEEGEEAVAKVLNTANKLCEVCGLWAPQLCAKCKRARYCCKSHQKHHWSSGHNKQCGEERPAFESSLLFVEHELATYAERFVDKSKSERSTNQRMEDYQKFLENKKDQQQQQQVKGKKHSYPVEELESLCKQADKNFKKFRQRIEQNPLQVIRYQLGGQPLLAADFTPQTTVPPCQHCGSRRQFEFQIMPHLLSCMEVDVVSSEGVDWATVCFYTCSANCNAAVVDYVDEYAWKQDYKND